MSRKGGRRPRGFELQTYKNIRPSNGEPVARSFFMPPKKRNFTLEVCRTISTVQQDLNIKTELKILIYSIFGAYPIAKYWAKVYYICRLG